MWLFNFILENLVSESLPDTFYIVNCALIAVVLPILIHM